MPPIGPIKRKELIRCFRELGFEGPFSGAKHQFMAKGNATIRIPKPHQSDIGRDLLLRILRQAKISTDEWVPLL
jgi:predicted RNA binding protein YcfA (HicA-like mRNA interferase family)